jgi:hypothetical protein
MRKLTQEEALEKILNKCKEKNYILLDEFIYNNAYSKLYLKCNKDNYEWYTTYNNFINNNYNCKKCYSNKQSNNLKLTELSVIKNIFKKCKEKNYSLLENFTYIDSHKSNIHFRCNKDNYEWFTNYDRFINSDKGCSKCGGNLKLTQIEANEKVNEKCKEKNYILLKSFIYSKNVKINLKCNKDNHIWNPTYNNFITKDSCCPLCAKLVINKIEAENKVIEKCLKLNYTLLNIFNFENSYSRIFLKCNIDNYIWDSSYYNFILKNSCCPDCGRKYKKSENRIKEILDKNNIKFIYQYKNKDILGLQSLDFYLPDYNIAIEYQGGQHFKSVKHFGGEKRFNENIIRDKEKYEKCLKNDIKLLYFTYEKNIPEDYFSKIFINENELIEKIRN